MLKIFKSKYFYIVIVVIAIIIYWIFFSKSKGIVKSTPKPKDLLNPLVLNGDIFISIPPGRTLYQLARDSSQGAFYVLRGNRVYRITETGKTDVTDTPLGMAVNSRCRTKNCSVNENKMSVGGKEVGVIDDDLSSFLTSCPTGESSNNAGWCYTGRVIDGACQVVNCSSYNVNEYSKF
jgi:hypothetical protein